MLLKITTDKCYFIFFYNTVNLKAAVRKFCSLPPSMFENLELQ